jgi:predicted nucleic acid-binding protein
MKETIASGAVVLLPSISVIEFIYLTEKGRLPALARDRFEAALTEQDSGMRVVPLTLGIARDLARVPWKAVPDMPDRVIAATALHLGLPLISRDSRIQVPGLEVIW